MHEDVAAPAMFMCELINWDAAQAAMKWTDARHRSARARSSKSAWATATRSMSCITGEITALELAVSAGEVPTLERARLRPQPSPHDGPPGPRSRT